MSRIDVPYCPDDADGEFGWLWDDDSDAAGEGGWQLVVTRVRGSEAALRFIDPGASEADSDLWADADAYLGQPYLRCCPPACDPESPLMVRVHLEHGATVTCEWAKDADPDRVAAIRDAVLQALTKEEPPK